jgi:Tfp pilus assembly protein PilV
VVAVDAEAADDKDMMPVSFTQSSQDGVVASGRNRWNRRLESTTPQRSDTVLDERAPGQRAPHSAQPMHVLGLAQLQLETKTKRALFA